MHSEGIEIMLPEYLPPFVHEDTCGGRPGKADCVQWCNRMLGGWVEEWHIPRKTASEWGFYSMQPQIMQWLSSRHQAVLATFPGFRKRPHRCTEQMCHSFMHPPNTQVCHCKWSVLPVITPL